MPTTERFGMQRKIAANMTAAGWWETPHASFLYDADVTEFLRWLKELNAQRDAAEAITLNTAMLKVIAEGVKACPKMNGHINYSRRLASGSVTYFEQIDVTMPVMLDVGMVTLNIRGVEQKSMSEIRDTVADMLRKAKNTNMQQAMYEVSLHDTLLELKRLHIVRALGRFLGFWLEGGPKTLLHGAEKRKYNAIPTSERLTRLDLEQGTIMVTNPGGLFRKWKIAGPMLEIIPPQIAAVAINAVQDRAVVDPDGALRAGKVLSMTVAIDHRAMDADKLVPFFARVEELLSAPEKLVQFV